MIGLVSVECQAQSPNLPLYPWTAFVNSPSSIRVRNVPKKIGSWCITRVYVSVVYPDGQIKTADCVPVGGVYVGTVAGAGVSGTTENGYVIMADGVDENGDAVTGYVLGRGNVTILDDDGILQPDAKRYYVRMLSADTENHYEGDLYRSNGTWYIWQDGQSWSIGDDSGKIAELSAKVETKADLSVLDNYVTTDDFDEAISVKADLSALNDVADDLAELENGLSDYYTKSETSSNVELETALSAKRDIEDLNYIRRIDYNHPENIIGFTVRTASATTPTYTMTKFKKVSDTQYEWHQFGYHGSDDYHVVLDLSDAEAPVLTWRHNSVNPIITTFEIPAGATSFSHEFQYYNVNYVIELLAEDTIAMKNDNISQFRNDADYLTPSDIEPFPEGSQLRGYAQRAYQSTGLLVSSPTNDNVVLSELEDASNTVAKWDNGSRGGIILVQNHVPYPWYLSMLNGTTFDPAIQLNWGYYYITRRQGSRLRTVWRSFGWMSDYVNGVAYLIGTNTSTGVSSLITLNGSAITDSYTSKVITVASDGLSVETYDGQTGNITCTRTSTGNEYSTRICAFRDEIPTAVSQLTNDSGFITSADIPTKTSELSNDSGFIEQNGAAVIHDLTCDSLVANQAHIVGYATESDLSAKRDLSDMTVKGVPQNTNSQSWFTIKYGTTTENAWYYAEGRWESGQTLRVLAAPAAIFSLQKMIQEQWTDIGEFTLDNNSEATVTYDGVTYSITGYIGDIVVSNQLISQIAALEARIAALEGN